MSNFLGNKLKIAVFGQSHSSAIGVTIDGLPAGAEIDLDELRSFMSRRAPGRNDVSTKRKEADEPEFICGIVDAKTCGAPVTAIIRNTNTRSSDYAELRDKPRPAHADYTAYVKYGGYNDIAGGGQFSGRLTAPICIAGGIALQLLKEKNIHVYAHIASIGETDDTPYELTGPFEDVSRKDLPVIDDEAAERMRRAVVDAAREGDSLGGVIECAITGVKAGVGEPMFDGLENAIARAIFGIPAVRGIEFGKGFAAARMRGSEHNDEFFIKDGEIRTKTNNHGGILGGISSGMPIVFRTAIKPTPSIAKEQGTVSLSARQDERLRIKGRHDPCIVPRAVPVVEAVAALVIADAVL